jgi:TatD DNase family protein
MPDFFDIHSHLHFPDYDKDRDQVIARMIKKNVWTIGVGVDLATSKKEIEIASKHKNIFTCIGLHPVDGPAGISADLSFPTFDEKAFAELVTHPKVVAIGECGLDYGKSGVVDELEKTRQKKDFERQIDFAVRYNKPLMLHVRNSHADILDILISKKREHGDKLRGNVHFFSGTTEIEKKYLDLNFSVSFTGVITFAENYDEAIKYAPLNMLMSETDAPFVAPIPYRGKRNEPIYVESVVKKMAQIKAKTTKEMQKILVDNAIRIFNIPL